MYFLPRARHVYFIPMLRSWTHFCFWWTLLLMHALSAKLFIGGRAPGGHTHTQLSVCSCMCTFRNFQCRLSKFWTTNCSCFKTVEFKLNSNWTKDVGWQSVINSVEILIHQWLRLLVLLTVMQSWGLHCVEVAISTAHCRSKHSIPFQWFAWWGVSLLLYSPNIPIFVSHQIEWLFVLSFGFHRLSIQNWKIYKN